jgi:uncharacterized protein
MEINLTTSAALTLAFALSLSEPSAATDTEPTMNQVYQEATTGRLDRAQQMITDVLAKHPNSARAHYVQAELYVKEGQMALARSELASAERLNPGLTEFKPASVRELRVQLDLQHGRPARVRRFLVRRAFPFPTRTGSWWCP